MGTFLPQKTMLKTERVNVTIVDVAKESGISKSTISRYLRGEVVSSEKALLIEQALRSSGYVRNNFAQYMRTKKTDLIGIVVPDLDNPFFTKIIKRLEEIAFDNGQSLIIKTTSRSIEREKAAIQYIRGFRVDALFLCRSQLEETDLLELELGMPVISIDKSYETIHSVVSNNYENGYLLTTHMLKQHATPIGFFLRVDESESVLERLRGYQDVCHEHDLDPLVFTYDVTQGIDGQKFIHFVRAHQIKGLICRNDNDAVKVMSIVKDQIALNTIDPIRIAGFDNISISSQITPELTTIDQHIEAMCDKAYEILRQSPLTVIHQIHPSELIVRESTQQGVKR
jgi:DNA-binding LacI/PurR family transcriptional regulator